MPEYANLVVRVSTSGVAATDRALQGLEDSSSAAEDSVSSLSDEFSSLSQDSGAASTRILT